MKIIKLYSPSPLIKKILVLIHKVLFLLFVSVLLFVNNQSHAQIYQTSIFDSVKIIPENPNTTDYIKIISYTAQRSSPCYFDSSKVIIQSNVINATFYYRAYGFLAEYVMIDTIDLGYLPPGLYDLNSDLLTFSYTDTIVDTIALNFIVTRNAVDLENENKLELLNIFPNPATNQLNFTLNEIPNSLNLEIFDSSGKKVKTKNIQNNSNEDFKGSIDISELKNGLYFCKFTSGNKQITRKFVKQ